MGNTATYKRWSDGSTSIMAFKIVERLAKTRSNQILLTEGVLKQVKDPALIHLCKFVGVFKVPFVGVSYLYRVTKRN